MKEKVAQLKEQAQSSIESAASLHELEEIRVSLLGKKGELTEISKGMKIFLQRKDLLLVS